MAGELDVEAMLRRLTGKQFREWEMYNQIEPFGELRADYRTAVIEKMLYDVNGGAKQKALTVEDFLLQQKFEPPTKPEAPKQDQFALMKLLAAAYSNPVPQPAGIDADVSAEMRAQVARAHDAMKES
jgi:hypothetical protein